MDLIIIVNDQIKYSFESIKNLSFVSEDSGEIQILENHAEAFFSIKANSIMNIVISDLLNKKFKIESDGNTAQIQKDTSGKTSKNIIKIICSKIIEK
jgi:hypothetical protein